MILFSDVRIYTFYVHMSFFRRYNVMNPNHKLSHNAALIYDIISLVH